MFKNILVPVDGNELSDSAVKHACEFAKESGARLTFYYAKPDYIPAYISSDVELGNVSIDEAFASAMRKQAETILTNAAQVAANAGVEYETLSEHCASPHAGIIAAASKGCDLIFMASHGRRGASALLLGSETQKVLTHCKVPVLVFR